MFWVMIEFGAQQNFDLAISAIWFPEDRMHIIPAWMDLAENGGKDVA